MDVMLLCSRIPGYTNVLMLVQLRKTKQANLAQNEPTQNKTSECNTTLTNPTQNQLMQHKIINAVQNELQLLNMS